MEGGPVNLLLDTQALLWWLAGDGELTPAQAEALPRAESAGHPLGVPAIALWELARLVERGQIEARVSIDALFEEIESHPRLQILPITPRVALESTRLGRAFPRDPADQLIAATARVHGLRLVTKDREIRRSGVVAVL